MDPIVVRSVAAGEDVRETGESWHEVVNPATGEVIARAASADAATVDRIVTSSAEAFQSTRWQSLQPADRGRFLYALAESLEQEAEPFIELELLDTGKPITQLRGAEIPLAAAIIRFYAGAADKIEGAVKSTSGGFHLTCYEPYGVVAGILPWNYPLVNAAMKVAPALAAGNAIVLKPSVETPLTTAAFAKLCHRVGLPDGIVNVVLGPGASTGNALCAHPLVKKISFTGSTAVGRSLQQLAAEQMKMVNLECGGKNAIIVFDDADLERAAEAALISAFINCGQLCVSCSRVLVQERVADEFEKQLVAKLGKVKVGDPRDPQTMVGPMITRAQYDTALSYLKGAPAEGCAILTGGGRLKQEGACKNGFWLQPTLLSRVKPEMKVAREEIFGPVLSVLRFRDEAEAVTLANSVEYGLSGSVWTRDQATALRMVKALDTGIIWVNCMMEGYPQIPVPPHKMSGTGVELGMEGLLAYCKRKSAVLSYNDQSPIGWNVG